MTAPNRPSPNDLLMGFSGPPPAAWSDSQTRQDYPVGTSYAGYITKMDVTAQRNINDKSKIDVWPDGSTKWITLITLATGRIDPAVEDDDGQRTLWVSGKWITQAVRKGIQDAHAKEAEVGGWLKVTMTGYGPLIPPATRPPRAFEAQYRKPSPEGMAAAQRFGAANDDPWAEGTGGAFDPSDPWNAGPASQPLQQPAQVPQGVPSNGGVAPVPVAAASPAQATTGAANPTPAGGMIDPASLSPEALAIYQRMAAEQQARSGGQ